MGNCCLPFRFHRTPSAINNPKNVTLLLVGLDKSGKTTIAKRLAGEPIDSVVPTVGFSVVTLRQKGCRVSVYDLGGGPQIRDIWNRYYADAHGVIFVVDAIDTDRLDECRLLLQNLLQSSQISGKPVLLLANKQDLEGALDEIDIVERLNLEKVVNEQKCPTLVELCSALHFSRKIDAGIDNGYKWLIRGIIRDYPSLNNRVLRDLAKQEDENRVQVIRSTRRNEKMIDEAANQMDGNQNHNPFRPLKEILEGKKNQMNGIANSKNHLTESIPKIPGLVEDQTERLDERKIQIRRFLSEEKEEEEEEEGRRRSISSVVPRINSSTSEFFLFEKFQSDEELLKDISNLPNQNLRNFLVRPKSSGARLYGIRSEKRTQRRKPLLKSNKTGPSPFTDFFRGQMPEMEKSSNQTESTSAAKGRFLSSPVSGDSSICIISRKESAKVFEENRNPFMVVDGNQKEGQKQGQELNFIRKSKSTSNSRKGSGSVENSAKRRNSLVNSKFTDGYSKMEQIPPLKANNRLNSKKEILLDVSQLKH